MLLVRPDFQLRKSGLVSVRGCVYGAKDMRGFGDFQRGQMKQVDPLVPELFRNLRQAIDILERMAIASSSVASPNEAVARKTIEPTSLESPTLPQHVSLTCTIKDVCERTGLGRSRVYQAIGLGELRAAKCGHRTLIQVKDLQALIDSWPIVSRKR